MLRDKKGNWAFFGLAAGVFIASGIILANLLLNTPTFDQVGDTAKTVLRNVEKQQESYLDLDQKVDGASKKAAQQTAEENGLVNKKPCKQLGYEVIGQDCELSLMKTFKDNLESEIADVERNIQGQTEPVRLKTQISDAWTISYQSETSILYKVSSTIQKDTDKQKTGTTAFGDPIVSVNDIPNVKCDTDSCTAYEKPCAVKPALYNKLQQLSDYAEKHGLTIRIRSSTRTEKMQRFFYDSQHHCQQTKNQICKNEDSSQECNKKYISYLESQDLDNKRLCNPRGTCTPACNPTIEGPSGETKLNKGCTHMTGNAVDIGLKDGDRLINKEPELQDPMRRTLCDLGFVNYYEEVWHYEYNSESWKQIKSKDELDCAYADGNKDWSSVPPLHEVMES